MPATDKRASELTAPVSIADTDMFAGYRPGTGGEPNLDIKASAGLIRAPIIADLAAGNLRVGGAVNALSVGVVGDGVTDDSAAVNAALSTYGRVIFPGFRTYKIANILLKTGCFFDALPDATFIPTAGGVTMFKTTGDYSSVLSDQRRFTVRGVHVTNPNLVSNVTVFYMPNARYQVILDGIRISAGGYTYNWDGYVFPVLNWRTYVRACEADSCGRGFVGRNAAAIMDFVQCSANRNGIGWDFARSDLVNSALAATDPAYDYNYITEIRITGGVNQDNGIGMKFYKTSSTMLTGVHFENNATADVDSNGCDNMLMDVCRHWGSQNSGNNSGGIPYGSTVGVKLRNTTAFLSRKPVFSGVRNGGFWDVDTTNVHACADVSSRSTAPLVNSNFISSPGTNAGLRWINIADQPQNVLSSNINCEIPRCNYVRDVASGALTITSSNDKDQFEFILELRLGSSWSGGAMTVCGRSLDMTNAAANKVKILHMRYDGSKTAWYFVSNMEWV